METSAETGQLATALVAAQGAIGAMAKGGRNPHLNSNFTTYEDMVRGTKLPLLTEGLVISQLLESSGTTVAVTTMLMHSSGEWLRSSVGMPYNASKGINPAQALGLTVTYLRRYAYGSILGLVSGNDNDGHGLVIPDPEEAPQAASDPSPTQQGAYQRQGAASPPEEPEGYDRSQPADDWDAKHWDTLCEAVLLQWPLPAGMSAGGCVTSFLIGKRKLHPSQATPEQRLKLLEYLQTEQGWGAFVGYHRVND